MRSSSSPRPSVPLAIAVPLSSAPRIGGAADVDRPDRRRHRPLRLHGGGCAGCDHDRVATGCPSRTRPAGRTSTSSTTTRTTTSTSTTRRRRADIRYLFDFATKTRNPNSFLYTTASRSTRSESQNLNVIQTYSVTRNGRRRLGGACRAPPHPAEQRRPEDDPGLREGRGGRDRGTARRRQGVRRSARVPVLRGLGRIFDTVNLTGAGLGNEGGGVDDLAGYAFSRSSSRFPRPRSRPTASRSPTRRPPTRSSASGPRPSARRSTPTARAAARGSRSPASATRSSTR